MTSFLSFALLGRSDFSWREVQPLVLADELERITGCEPTITRITHNVSPRRWWHNLSLRLDYAREWAGVIK